MLVVLRRHTCSDKADTALLPVQYQSMPRAEVNSAIRATKGRISESLSDLEARTGCGSGVTRLWQ